jgi:hypothetical protein
MNYCFIKSSKEIIFLLQWKLEFNINDQFFIKKRVHESFDENEFQIFQIIESNLIIN